MKRFRPTLGRLAALLPALLLPGTTWSGQYLVLNNLDGLDPGPPGSLRSAIHAVNLGTDPNPVVNIDPAVRGLIVLTSGQLVLNYSATIQGPGADVLTITNGTGRIFMVNAPIIISGLTMSGTVQGQRGQDGDCSHIPTTLDGGNGEDAAGGGIWANSDLTLSNCVMRSCYAIAGAGGDGYECFCSGPFCVTQYDYSGSGGHGGDAAGGAIKTDHSIFAYNCTFSDDHAIAGNGGRGANHFATDTAGWGGTGGSAFGGAIAFAYSPGGVTFRFQNCTFYTNTANGGMGGPGGTNFSLTTGISGDGGSSGNAEGGALYAGGLTSGAMFDPDGIRSCTFNHNSCIDFQGAYGGPGTLSGVQPGLPGSSGRAAGAGLNLVGSIFQNSIVAGNYFGFPLTFAIGQHDQSADISGDVNSEGCNFIGVADGIFWSPGPQSTDQFGSWGQPRDPKLAPVLRNNGGSTPTLALLAGSPAIDAGDANGLATDQRGFPRKKDFDDLVYPNVTPDASDIGAFEAPAPVIWSDTLGGKWEDQSKWLDHIRPSLIADVYITNDSPKFVRIDGITAQNPALLSVNSLTLGCPVGTNTLLLSQLSPPLNIPDVYIQRGGLLDAEFSTSLNVRNYHTLQVDGILNMNNSGLTALTAKVGLTSHGIVNLTGGSAQLSDLLVGCGSSGVFQNLNAGVNLTNLMLGTTNGSSGLVVMSGGTLSQPLSGVLSIGAGGSGQFIHNGGTIYAGTVLLTNGSRSTLQMGGGTLNCSALVTSPGATVSGQGTINGPLTNSGTLTATGGNLVLTGPLTNTGTLSAASDGVLSLFGPLVNTGTLDLRTGSVQVPGGLQNSGTVLVSSGAVHNVLNLNDGGPGSLRDAITTSADGDTITFGITGWLLLTNELIVSKRLNIIGSGAPNLSISGGNACRILNVQTGAVVSISGLTLRNGAPPSSPGGGIYNRGSLALSDCVITSCSVTGVDVNIYYGLVGGAGFNDAGILTANRCTFNGNVVAPGNSQGFNGLGGALFNNGGTVALTNCTFSGNSATAGPGGYGLGGALSSTAPTGGVFLINCTVSGNSASVAPAGSQPGGAAYGGGAFFGNGFLVLKNTAIGGNQVSPGLGTPNGSALQPDLFMYSPVLLSDAGWNAIGAAGGTDGLTPVANDVSGTQAAPLDLKLDALMDNGGPTPTIGLLSGSPALGAGNSAGIATDQRGQPRPASGSDIGAFQTIGLAPEPLRITAVSVQRTNVFISWNAYFGQAYVVQKASLSDPQWPLHFANASPVVYSPAYGYGNTSYVAKVAIPTTPSPSDSGSGFRVMRIGPLPPSAFDDAGQPGYALGRFSGENSGQGFQPWAFIGAWNGAVTPLPEDNLYLGDSSQNGTGNSGGINSGNGLSWALSAQQGTALGAFRVFNHDLAVNQVLELDLDNGLVALVPGSFSPPLIAIPTSPSAGFSLTSSEPVFGNDPTYSGLRFSFAFTGGQANYAIADASGIRDTGLPFTDGGVHIAFKLTGSGDTFSLTLRAKNSGAPVNLTGTLLNHGSIHTLLIFDSEAGPSPSHDLYFNNLAITP